MLLLIGLLLVLFAQAPARPPEDTRGTASVSGRITEHGSGQPLPRMLVLLESASHSLRRTLTDEQGRYAFTDVPPGEYALSAGPNANRARHLRHRYGETAPVPRFGSRQPRPNITLKPGEVRAAQDMALMRSLAIEGRVLDPSDEPIARVNVFVMNADGRSVAAEPEYSDDLGFYRIYGLPPGRYKVCARVDGNKVDLEERRLVRTCHLNAVREQDGSDISLTTGDATAIDIRVQRVGTHVIAGSVVDASGAPLDGAHVSAIGGSEGVNGSTNSVHGAFAIKGLAPGRYLVRGSIGGSNRGDPNLPTREQEIGYASADVTAADAAGVSLVLSKPTTVSGRVLLSGDRAPSPRGLRMLVHAPDEPERDFFDMPPRSAVDDNLRFELKGVYPLPRVVRVQGIPDGWAVSAIKFGDRDVMHLPTDLTVTTTPAGLTIHLTDRVAQPSIRIADDGDHAAQPHYVVVGPADPARWRYGFTTLPSAGTTERLIRIGSLSPGDYLVAAVRWDETALLWRDPLHRDALRQVATRVSLAAGDRPTIDVKVVRLPPRGDR